MSTTNINVKILAEMLGVPSLNKGAKAGSGLETGFKKLAAAIGIGLGTAEIVKFGKESLAAFTADEKAAAVLAQTLKNVNQGFADTRIEKFITNTSLATGILKNDLRDAFDSLVRQTHNAATAQDLLNTAINISAGSGKDLGTVAASLAKAYGGQTQAIARLNVGLTKADLTGKSFAEIQTKLNKLFAGQAAIAADTYAGKIKRMNAVFEESKVIIGKGMVDAFTSLSQNGSLDNFTQSMQNSAQYVADILVGLGQIGGKLNSLNNGKSVNWLSDILALSPLKLLQQSGAKTRTAAENLAAQAASSISTRGAGRLANQTMAQTIADQNAATAALAKANAEKAKQLKLDTAIAMLKKSMAIFDLQKIQIAAALQNKKLTADEENRLKLMQAQADLQQAIDDKNTAALDPLMQKIKDLQDQIAAISQLSAGNPFAEMLAGATAAGIATVALLNSIESRLPKAMVGLSSEAAAAIGESRLNANSVPASPTSTGLTDAQLSQIYDPTVNVHVTLDGQVVANAVTNTVTSNQQTNSQAGVQPFWARNNVPNAGQW